MTLNLLRKMNARDFVLVLFAAATAVFAIYIYWAGKRQ